VAATPGLWFVARDLLFVAAHLWFVAGDL